MSDSIATKRDNVLLATDVVQLEMMDELGKKTRIGTKYNLQTLTFQRLILFSVYGILVGIFTYLVGSVMIARRSYARMVDLVDGAIAMKLYNGPSGTRTAFAFHMGRLGAFLAGFPNANLPGAIVVMCYEKKWSSVFETQGGDQNEPQGIQNWFQCIHDIAIQNSNLTAAQIFCSALDCSRGSTDYKCPKNNLCPNVISCLPDCNPTAYVQTDTNTNIVMKGINGAISMGAGASVVGLSAGGPIAIAAIALGAIFGGSLGAARAIEESKQIHNQCVSMRKNCVMVAGAPACGGFS